MSPADAAVGYMRVTAEAELKAWEAVGHPDPQLVRQVLYVYGRDVPAAAHAVPPGSFRNSLIDACSRADAENRLRLSLGFPELVATINVVELVQDGVARLVALLERKA